MQLNDWWNFFSLCATAAVTLMGLTFIAVTLGQSLIKKETLHLANLFFSPSFYNFFHVFLLCLLIAVPTITSATLGVVCLLSALWRMVQLPHARTLLSKEAKEKEGAIEHSDFIMIVYLPAIIYLLLAGAGVAFFLGKPWAVDALALSVIALLVAAVKSAWDMLLWTASTLR